MVALISRNHLTKITALALFATIFSGCSSQNDKQELNTYMAMVHKKPVGAIEPLPPFKSYESFSYKAARLRDPFSQPVEVVIAKKKAAIDYSVTPDLNRSKEYLEGFNLAALKMVGSIEKNSAVWALVNDSQGGIYSITEGNYLGRNHGKVARAFDGYIEIVEIVPDGQGGWLERPQRLAIDE